jgi:sugar lactone lactonase YvrE
MRFTIVVAIALLSSTIIQAQIKNMKIEGKITSTPAMLGESLMWDYRDNSLYWIDIEGKKVHQYFAETKIDNELALPKRPGTVVLTEKTGNCVLALEDSISFVTIASKRIDMISGPSFEGKPLRFNDGKCDPNGTFWLGTVDTKNYSDPIAKLYKIEKDKTFTVELEGVTISNGICWSPDGTKMYYIDSPTRSVVAYNFDLKTGKKSNPQTVIHTPENLGTPDGSTIDAEGMIWIAQWGGACVTRWNPKTGEMIAKVDVPAKNVTSVAFGGKNLDILYITTAQIAMSHDEEKQYPEAGHIFYVSPGVKGVKAYIFRN